MKSSLKKLRGFALHKHDKDRRQHQPPAVPQDELLQASQDMLDMRSCYDGLFSAAAATTNCAYEFSEALRELGTCLLAKTALNDDEEIGRVLLMLGKAQFELQKLVDNYRIHIIKTIATPSESLLKELQTVEDMKRQCDDKRDIYKSMVAAQVEKGRTRNTKGESFSQQQLKAAQEDYQEETTLFLFRLKSLKQGQSRSLLTQAARHHAAQLNFFRKGVKSLEVVEPHVREVAEQQHIDYQFSGLEDDAEEFEDDDGDDYDSNYDGELSFDYGHHGRVQDVSITRSSVELDQVDQSSNTVSTTEVAKENIDRSHADFLLFSRAPRTVSLSEPLLADKKPELSEKQLRPSATRKFHTYVLPTPVDAKNSPLTGSGDSVSAPRVVNKDDFPSTLWRSSPLQPNLLGKDLKDVKFQNPSRLPNAHSILKESNTYSGPIRTPPSFDSHAIPSNASDSAKFKLQGFSGPLMSEKPVSSNPTFSLTGSMSSVEFPSAVPVKPAYIPPSQPSSGRRVPLTASPPSMSPPIINELHELPRPPVGAVNTKRPSNLIAHSAPLVPRGQEHHQTTKPESKSSYMATPLPAPPGAMARSFSIPSGGPRASNVAVAEFLEVPHSQTMTVVISSPPLTPMASRIVS